MNLRDWMKRNGKAGADMVELLHVSMPTLSRFINGHRIPNPHVMRRIFQVTGGEVQPNDFYALAEWRGELEAGNGQPGLPLEAAE